MRHNDVPEILFPTANALLAAGKTVSDLTVGQLGIFSEATGLSVATPTENFFLAVGLDTNGDGTVDDIRKSAGRNIQPGNVVYATRQNYVAPVNKVVDVTNISAKCGESFGIKVEARNEQIYNVQGTIQYRETYMAKAANCDSCADDVCEEANTAQLVKDILLSYSKRPDQFFKLEAIADMGTGETAAVRVLTAAELDTIVAATEALADKSTQKKVGIRVTAFATKVQKFANVNLDYVAARQTEVLINVVGSLDAKATVNTLTELVYEQNSGYDIRELEFQTVGFREGNTGAYRIGAVTCLPNEVTYESQLGTQYNVFTIAYDHRHRNGSWLQYDNALATYIVVPTANTALNTVVQTLATTLTTKANLADDGQTGLQA